MPAYGISKGFDRSRKNGWSIRVDGRKGYYPSKELRDQDYTRKVGEAKLYGEAALKKVSPTDRQAISDMHRLAKPTGYSVMEIFERGLTLVGQKPRKTRSIDSAVADFLRVAKGRERDGLIRSRRMNELKSVLSRFAVKFANRDIHSIRPDDIDDYIASLGVGPQTRINNARVISRLFTWARIKDNPVIITDKVKRSPAIFRHDEVARLFSCAKDAYREIVPMLTLQWFAGIRPSATHWIRWEDINLHSKTVIIQAEINKLREPDLVTNLPDAFWGWVARNQGNTGRVAPADHIGINKRMHHAIGYGLGKGEKRWPEDVARHSFASHLFPLVESIDTVSKAICHRGNRVTLKHYVAKNVTIEEATAYFSLIDGL